MSGLIGGTWNFLKRHKGKIVLLGGAIGGYVYLQKVLNQVEKDWAKSTSRDFVSEVRKKEIHFEETIQTCNQTCLTLSANLIKILDELLNADVILNKLQQDKTNRDLWRELASTIVTRIIAEIYCCGLLVCYLRVQLSVIAGYIYVDSNNGTNQVTHAIRTKYLSLVSAFYKNGINGIIRPVQEAVDNVFGKVSLKERFNMGQLKIAFEEVRRSMAFSLRAPNSTASRFLIDPDQIEQLAAQFDDDEMPQTEPLTAADIALLTKMMRETQDILESPDFKQVLEASLELGYGFTLDVLMGCYVDMSDSTINHQFVNPNAKTLPLAKLLPAMRNAIEERRASSNTEDVYDLTRHLLCLDILNAFAANIYEAFCEPIKQT